MDNRNCSQNLVVKSEYVVTCYATEDAVQIVIGFITILHVVTTITSYAVTYLHSLHSNLFSLSAVVFAYSVSLLLKHLNNFQIFFTYELPVTVSYRELLFVKVKITLRLTVIQSVSLGIEPHLGPKTRYLFLSDSYVLISVGRPL
jgi:uncharacterized protein YebE (UPF0316 family)